MIIDICYLSFLNGQLFDPLRCQKLSEIMRLTLLLNASQINGVLIDFVETYRDLVVIVDPE